MDHATTFLILSLVACLSACDSSLSSHKYVAWIQQHHADLTDSQQLGEITASATYLPADWLAVKEAGAEHPAAIAVARQEYEGMEYYRLRIALQSGRGDLLQFGASSTDDYYQRVEYFSFAMQHDVRLLVGKDTLPCKLFHFERNYGAAPYADFMLGFESQGGNNFDRTVIYDDRAFAQRPIFLTILAKNISRVPTLKL